MRSRPEENNQFEVEASGQKGKLASSEIQGWSTSDGAEALGPAGRRTGRAGLVAELLFLVGSVCLLVFGSRFGFHDHTGDLAISFVAIVLEALPFVLLGTLLGGIVEAFVPQDVLRRALEGRKTFAIFVAAGLGGIFPVCECAIVPVTRRLLGKGVPLPAAVAFLLAVPIVNPIVASSTAIAYRFDWGFVVTRMACGYVIAVGVAFLVQYLWGRGDDVLVDSLTAGNHTCCGSHDHHHCEATGFRIGLVSAIRHGAEDFFQVAKYLIIGAFIAASARTVLGMETFVRFSESPWLAILVMMVLAVALNLCSEADAFIAAAFRGVMPATAQMGFMVLGPMLDLKLILMYLTLFRKRVIVTIGISVFLAVFACMLFLTYAVGGGFLG